MNDFYSIIIWWSLLFGAGVIFLPTVILVLGNLLDKGYVFAKTASILVVSYLVWLLGSLKILPFSVFTIIFSTATLFLLNIIIFTKNRTAIVQSTKSCWKIILFEEFLFFVVLATWSTIRGFQPDIRGLEKFMDFGFVNSILRSQYFPPQDMWFAGEPVNYYYFGHLVSAVLTKLSAIPSHITYNLLIATIFALSFTCAFCLGATLVHTFSAKRIRYAVVGGFLTSILLTLGGNLHPLYWLIKSGSLANYWYPDATRFIVQQFGAADNTIHEFPIYSFVVADLHGHLINLPFVLLFLAIMLTIFLNKHVSLFLGFFVSWLLGIFYITNAWDFPIYLSVFGLLILYFNWLKYGLSISFRGLKVHGFLSKSFQALRQSMPRNLETFPRLHPRSKRARGFGEAVITTMARTVMAGLFVVAAAIFFSLPFHINFENISKGIGIVDFHSPPWMLATLWGLPLVTTLVFFVFLFLQKKTFHKKPLETDVFIIILISISWFLVLLPEIIYVKDIYIHSYQRANTVFKFTYQSFVMFSLASAYAITRLATSGPLRKRRFLQIGLLLPIASCLLPILLYPFFAVRSYYGLKNYQGLSGESWLAREYPAEYQALKWLTDTKGQPIVLEATGDSYTDYNVISSYTGLPTVQGWTVHEWLWRGSFDEPGKRATEVETIYTTEDAGKTSEVLNKYNIEYIVVGSLERQKYPNLQEGKFAILGKLVFSSSETNIYKVN